MHSSLCMIYEFSPRSSSKWHIFLCSPVFTDFSVFPDFRTQNPIFAPMQLYNQTIHLLKKEILLEWRSKYAFKFYYKFNRIALLLKYIINKTINIRVKMHIPHIFIPKPTYRVIVTGH